MPANNSLGDVTNQLPLKSTTFFLEDLQISISNSTQHHIIPVLSRGEDGVRGWADIQCFPFVLHLY